MVLQYGTLWFGQWRDLIITPRGRCQLRRVQIHHPNIIGQPESKALISMYHSYIKNSYFTWNSFCRPKTRQAHRWQRAWEPTAAARRNWGKWAAAVWRGTCTRVDKALSQTPWQTWRVRYSRATETAPCSPVLSVSTPSGTSPRPAVRGVNVVGNPQGRISCDPAGQREAVRAQWATTPPPKQERRQPLTKLTDLHMYEYVPRD